MCSSPLPLRSAWPKTLRVIAAYRASQTGLDQILRLITDTPSFVTEWSIAMARDIAARMGVVGVSFACADQWSLTPVSPPVQILGTVKATFHSNMLCATGCVATNCL